MSWREFTTAPRRETADADSAPPVVFDLLPFCIFTTVALLAWITNAALVVTIMSALGMLAYWRAIRAGLRTSRCVLGDYAHCDGVSGGGVLHRWSSRCREGAMTPGSVRMLRRLIFVLLIAVAPSAMAQRSGMTQGMGAPPSYWVTGSIGFFGNFTVADPSTHGLWDFGLGRQYRLSLEAPPTSGHLVYGVTGGYATAPLNFEGDGTVPCGLCSARMTVTQAMGTIGYFTTPIVSRRSRSSPMYGFEFWAGAPCRSPVWPPLMDRRSP